MHFSEHPGEAGYGTSTVGSGLPDGARLLGGSRTHPWIPLNTPAGPGDSMGRMEHSASGVFAASDRVRWSGSEHLHQGVPATPEGSQPTTRVSCDRWINLGPYLSGAAAVSVWN